MARSDESVVAAAFVGSAASGREDAFSDIDLALRFGHGVDFAGVVESWTAAMFSEHGAVDHLDIWSGRTLYRVFLIDSSLQVDLSFWPYEDFAGTGEPFRIIFGESNPAAVFPNVDVSALIGMGWLHALHVRSAIARGRLWQAISMLDGLRDRALAIACFAAGVRVGQARDVDLLDPELLGRFRAALVTDAASAEVRRAFGVTTELFLEQVGSLDLARADRLRGPLHELVRSAERPAE
jgi:hypothetical protein